MELLSNLYWIPDPFKKNCAESNDLSSFVSDNEIKNSNLFFMEFMFKSPTIRFIEKFSFNYLRTILASMIHSRQVCCLSLLTQWIIWNVIRTIYILLYFRVSFIIFFTKLVERIFVWLSITLIYAIGSWYFKFLKKLLTSRKKFYISKSLPERFKCRPPFQGCSFLLFELHIKWKSCMRHLALELYLLH